jgi:hypothetical protein
MKLVVQLPRHSHENMPVTLGFSRGRMHWLQRLPGLLWLGVPNHEEGKAKVGNHSRVQNRRYHDHRSQVR